MLSVACMVGVLGTWWAGLSEEKKRMQQKYKLTLNEFLTSFYLVKVYGGRE